MSKWTSVLLSLAAFLILDLAFLLVGTLNVPTLYFQAGWIIAMCLWGKDK